MKSEADNKGYAFVTFRDTTSVTLVLENHKNILLRAKPLDIKYVKAECGFFQTQKQFSDIMTERGGSTIHDFKPQSNLRTLTFSHPSSGKELSQQLFDSGEPGIRKKVLSNPEFPRTVQYGDSQLSKN